MMMSSDLGSLIFTFQDRGNFKNAIFYIKTMRDVGNS